MAGRRANGNAVADGKLADRIVSFHMLEAERCEQLAKAVLNLKPHWRHRGTFWTLGASTYNDDVMAYMGIAHQDNSIITRHFGGLMQEIADLFQTIMNKETVFLHSHGLPGFHIFDHTANDKGGSIHIDEPYTRCFWPCAVTDPFTFTLPVELPGEGGLNLYHGNADTIKGHSGSIPEPEYYPYEIGHMYIHDGLTIHQIANPVDMNKDQHRMSLQGHGATLANNQIALYF